jgi:hypothetical protein
MVPGLIKASEHFYQRDNCSQKAKQSHLDNTLQTPQPRRPSRFKVESYMAASMLQSRYQWFSDCDIVQPELTGMFVNSMRSPPDVTPQNKIKASQRISIQYLMHI